MAVRADARGRLELRFRHGPDERPLAVTRVEARQARHQPVARELHLVHDLDGDHVERAPGIVATSVEQGYWRTLPVHLPAGRYTYKFLLDGRRWLDDPNNPRKAPDGLGSLNSVVVVPEEIYPEASRDSGLSSMIATQTGS